MPDHLTPPVRWRRTRFPTHDVHLLGAGRRNPRLHPRSNRKELTSHAVAGSALEPFKDDCTVMTGLPMLQRRPWLMLLPAHWHQYRPQREDADFGRSATRPASTAAPRVFLHWCWAPSRDRVWRSCADDALLEQESNPHHSGESARGAFRKTVRQRRQQHHRHGQAQPWPSAEASWIQSGSRRRRFKAGSETATGNGSNNTSPQFATWRNGSRLRGNGSIGLNQR